jgi:hypothetical protein
MVEAAGALAARAYFALCLAMGRMLRSARYSTVRIVQQDGQRLVRKHRRFYASVLIWMSGLAVRILDTGVRVLPQRDWEERERRIYQSLHQASIRMEADGTLILPVLAEYTLATLLEDPDLDESIRKRVLENATAALADFHRLGFTHADAMAENVLIDLDGGVAHWFDFETVHDTGRPLVWRRADDVRALLLTSLLRTPPEKRRQTLEFILDVYADEAVAHVLAATFTSIWRRSLTYDLLQAPLSFPCFDEIGRLLRARSPGAS